jgi:hypothetical protein
MFAVERRMTRGARGISVKQKIKGGEDQKSCLLTRQVIDGTVSCSGAH